MNFPNESIIEYLHDLTVVENPVYREMEQYGIENDFPIIGPVVGQLLMLLAKIVNAKRILELGSGFGYSAAWFFRALPEDGEIICTDRSEENISRGSDYFKSIGASNNIRYIKGDALESMDNTEGLFDIIFMDIDKKEYPRAYDKILPRLRQGGLMIADNTLWQGKVVEPDPDETTKAVQVFNKMIFGKKEVVTMIIPIRDGVSVSVKL